MTETVGVKMEPTASWAQAQLQDCVEVLDSRRVPINGKERQERISGKAESDLFPYYGATGQVGWIDDYLFDQEIVLLGEDGVPFLDPNKPKAYLISGKTWVNNHAHVLQAVQNVTSNKFVLYFLNQFDFHGYVTGTTRLKLNQARMREIPVPLPPLNEQRRIVEKIEELFTKLDAGVRSLEQVRAQLKSYRRSVLKAAVEGELSREWREAHKDEVESASELLERILQERREKFAGKKYKEPIIPDVSRLPMLPGGWTWATIDALLTFGPQNGIYLPQSAYGIGTPILRINDFQIGWSRSSNELRQVSTSNAEIEKYGLQEGDLIVNRVNSMTHLGKCLVVEERNLPALFESNMMRAHVTDLVNVQYLHIYLSSSTGRSRLIANAKQAVNQASINQADVGGTSLPLPPLKEQHLIVEEVDRRLSVVDKLEATVEENLKQANALRRSILKRAFSGELVPQDPDDEPASALLERIRKEREAAKQKKPDRRRRGKTGPTERVQAEQGGLF